MNLGDYPVNIVFSTIFNYKYILVAPFAVKQIALLTILNIYKQFFKSNELSHPNISDNVSIKYEYSSIVL